MREKFEVSAGELKENEEVFELQNLQTKAKQMAESVEREDGQQGNLYQVLFESDDYREKIGSPIKPENPLPRLFSYITCPGISLEKAKNAMEKFSAIHEEAKKAKPDVKKIDEILSGFMSERLGHFAKTFIPRVEKRAQALNDTSNSKEKDKFIEETNKSMGNVGKNLMHELEKVNGSFQAKSLIEIAKKIPSEVREKLGVIGDPFFADNFEEPKAER